MPVTDVLALMERKIVTFGEVQTEVEYLDGTATQITSGMLLRIWLDLTFPPLEHRVDATHLSAFFS